MIAFIRSWDFGCPIMGKKRRMREKRERTSIARERIGILYKEAENASAVNDRPRAHRYGWLARKIAMRYQVKLPKGSKILYCKKCGSFIGGTLSRVRLIKGRVSRTCFICNDIYRHPIRRE